MLFIIPEQKSNINSFVYKLLTVCVSRALWVKSAPTAAYNLTATWSKLFDWMAQETTSLIMDLTG